MVAQNKTTSAENPATLPLAGTELIRIVQSGNDAKCTAQDVANLVSIPLTTKGDLITSNGTTAQRLPIGTNGWMLSPNSSLPLGVGWSSAFVDYQALLATTAGAANLGYSPTVTYSAGTIGNAIFTGALTDVGYSTLQAAVTAAAGKTVSITRNWTLSAAISVTTGTSIIISAGVTVTFNGTGIHGFDCTSASKVWIFGPGKIVQTGATSNTNVGAVNFDSSIDCLVYGVEISGYEWSGVRMNNAARCGVYKFNIHDVGGTGQDSNAIVVHRNCVDCWADQGYVLNPGYVGVFVQDPGGTTNPLRTRISNVVVDGASAYGFADYHITNANSFTKYTNCIAINTTGVSYSGSSGAGFYCQGSGGVEHVGCTGKNNCTASANNTLTPATFGANNITAGLIAPKYTNCTSVDCGLTAAGVVNPNAINLAGFNVSSSVSGAQYTDITVVQTAALTAPGFIGLWINKSSNITVAGSNPFTFPTTGQATDGVFSYANGGNCSNIQVSGITMNGGTEAGIRCDQVGGFNTINLTINSVEITGGSAACIPLKLVSVIGYSIANFRGSATTTNAASYSSTTNGKTTCSSLTTTGTIAISTTGTCTGSYIDSSVDWNGTMSNVGTGFNIRTRAAAMPTTGSWQQGDIVENTAIALAAVIEWGRATNGSGNVLSTDWFKGGVYS